MKFNGKPGEPCTSCGMDRATDNGLCFECTDARPDITIQKTATGWTATFHGDLDVFKLFGTYTLPTAFTAQASAEMVKAELMKKNPGCTIQVA